MKKFTLFILLVSLFQTAHAIKVKTLYEANVPLAAQSDDLKDQAIQQAFVQTLIKVSGDPQIMDNATVKAALPQAKEKIQAYGYVPAKDASQPYLLNVQFDPQSIRKILHQANATVWGQNRPLIIVWLAVSGGGREAELMESGSNNKIAQLLNADAEQHGIPLLLPVIDLSALNQVSVESVKTGDLNALRAASERYHGEGILIGTLEENGPPIQSQWKLVVGDDEWTWKIDGDQPQQVIDGLLNRVSHTLMGRYAAVSADNAVSVLTVVIRGVTEH